MHDGIQYSIVPVLVHENQNPRSLHHVVHKETNLLDFSSDYSMCSY